MGEGTAHKNLLHWCRLRNVNRQPLTNSRETLETKVCICLNPHSTPFQRDLDTYDADMNVDALTVLQLYSMLKLLLLLCVTTCVVGKPYCCLIMVALNWKTGPQQVPPAVAPHVAAIDAVYALAAQRTHEAALRLHPPVTFFRSPDFTRRFYR